MNKKLFTLLLALVAIAMTAQAQNTNGHEYVDLGLPSGTLWATCNVGASKPEEYGYYFAWGETVGYTSDTSDGHSFDWANYKWCNGSSSRLTKYTGRDGKTELDLVNDAAYVNWGSSWRMPSLDQIKELIDNCNWEWTTLNGVYGRKATSKTNGNSIFLPAAGLRYDTSLYDAGSSGDYWSRSLYTSSGPGNGINAYYLGFNSGYENWYSNNRSGGLSVRPIVVNNQSSELLLNAANFPDANFRAALASILGISEGDEITAEKIAATTELWIGEKSIADLTGIEHFTALTYLNCNSNQLTSLDVPTNTALKGLECSGNQLTSLDVSKNTKLTHLVCDYNQLTSLDVSKNTALEWLCCNRTQLTSLDVSKNTALEWLCCNRTQLTSLDVSKNTALTRLECHSNRLTSLDVSKNTALTRLECYYNQLTSLDVSKNTALTRLECYYNPLTSLDVSKNTALTYLVCENNQLTELDVSLNTALAYLVCENNQLTELDVSLNTALAYLYCGNNQLASLDVSKNTALTRLSCVNNQLTSLDVSKNTALKDLYCYSNQIKGEAMDALVASLPTVETGYFCVINTKDEHEGNVCTKSQVAVAKGKGWTVYDYNGGNRPYPEYEGSDDATAKLLLNAENFPDANFRAALAEILGISEGDEITEAKIAATTELDVSKSYKTPDEAKIADLTGIEHFTALTKLYCDYNNLTTLDVSKNVKLEYLSCRKIPLASLDLSKNTELLELLLWSNQLTELDLSNNTKLEKLEFGNFANVDFPKNEVSSLNLSKNTALRTMNFQMLGLTSLDVSKNTALTKLYCYNNQLTSLDVSQNTALTNLRCDRNQLTALDVSNNIALTYLDCYSNQIKGEAMDALVGSLPTVENGEFHVINTKDTNEGNVCTKSQVAIAKGKGWTVYDYNGHPNDSQEYEGSDDAIAKLLLNAEHFPDANFRAALAEILGISEGDEITAEKIAATTELDVSSKQIADLTGIEHFTALTYLDCYYNQLTALDVSKNTALIVLICSNNQLTSLDVSGCTALTRLYCGGNQLTSLDVSKNTALTRLFCHYNQLTSLDVSKNTALENLQCHGNQLTSLDVSKNTALKLLACFSNQIKGEAMDALVASLPTVSKGSFYVIDTKDANEGNVCTKAQVAIAKEKGWTVYDYDNNGGSAQEYEGSDPVSEDIDPVDEDDNIDFGTDMNDGDDLNGNVIGDIYYNINTGNGGYNAAEGCIVVKKPTDDGTVNDLEGKDIFGEDFKSQFTGIVFKVPAGKGTIKVNAETTGNMLLKVKIGSNDPVEMELNGKLKVTFPYNVSETTYVYIYAGAANEAKGFGAPTSGDAALKIYGIEFIRDNTPTEINAVDSGELTVDSWYTIDGKKLAGDPTRKGVYIVNGKKVMK